MNNNNTGSPSMYYGKPNADEGQRVSSFPIGISGLPTESYDFTLGNGIGDGEEMISIKFIGIIITIIALIALFIYIYMWYSKASQASSLVNTTTASIGA